MNHPPFSLALKQHPLDFFVKGKFSQETPNPPSTPLRCFSQGVAVGLILTIRLGMATKQDVNHTGNFTISFG